MIAFVFALTVTSTSSNDIDVKVASLVSKMTLEEKVSLCHGGTDFSTKAIPRLGIPEFVMDDGPHGVRGPASTYFPTGISLASTWNPELMYEMGKGLGADARAHGFTVILGPAINMIRTPLGGRSFEYMSEDPYLAGSLATPYIRGVQSQGVAACAKHYAANSQELDRGFINSKIDERTLHEIYLPAFKAAVQKGGVLTAMAAYNKVNGWWCTENDVLQNQILKRDWGFRGAIMSDWGAVHHTVPAANYGLDLEMPGGSKNDFFGEALFSAVRSGEVKESTVDDKVTRILRAMYSAKAMAPAKARKANDPATQQTARRIADQSIILLKNDRNFLPLNAAKIKSIAIIGPAVNQKQGGSGGSSAVYPPYEVTPLEGIRRLVGPSIKISVARGTGYGDERLNAVPATALRSVVGHYFSNSRLEGEATTVSESKIDFNWTGGTPPAGLGKDNFSARWEAKLIAPKTGRYELGTSSDDGSRLFVDGKLFVDNWGDHGVETRSKAIDLRAGQEVSLRVEFYQAAGDAVCKLVWRTPGESRDTEINAAAELARKSDVAILCVGTNHSWDSEGGDKPSMNLMGDQARLVEKVVAANPRTIVVLVNGSPVDVRPWATQVPSIVEAWYAGMEGGNALADILFGRVNPSGKLPVSFPTQLSDSPAHQNGNYPGNHVDLRYDEGWLIGYRYFDKKSIAPAFPFGHGLSYTTFAYDGATVRQGGDTKFDLSFRVRNSGDRNGLEVAQVYVHAARTGTRPDKELRAYRKVSVAAGKSASVSVQLDKTAFAYWDSKKHNWRADAGDYDILVGSSSRDIRLKRRVHLARTISWSDSER